MDSPPISDPIVEAFEAVLRAALAPVVGRLRALETAAAALTPAEPVAPVPGPPGPPGAPGADGPGIESYVIDYDGERTITHRWTRDGTPGERIITIPALIYRGVHVAGRTYDRGDCVSLDGSIWHCNVETNGRPGDGAPAWTLAVKHGRDLRAGR